MKIVENGRAVCGIVLPKNPTARESFAAEEIINYANLMSGATLEISDKFDNLIIIGEPLKNALATELMSQQEFEKLVPGPEGFIIKSFGNKLLLAGSSKNPEEQERGTVYAVYELLERFFGCSFATFCKKDVCAGELVPKKETLELEDVCYVKPCADVGYRTAIVQHGCWVGKHDHPLNEQFVGWLAKNRYNRILTWSGIYEGYKKIGLLKQAEKRGILFSVGHHQAISMLLPYNGNEYFSECYGKTHPEYYKLLDDGTRYKVKDGDYGGQLILCMRNEELIRQIAENILTWSEANPQVDVITLWPQDFKEEQCQCGFCKNYSKSANYSYFANKVIDIVNRANPKIKIDRISYLDLTDCDGEKLSKSVIIDEATWHDKLRTVGKPDGSGFAGSVFENNILEWKNTGATVVYYDYLMGNYGAQQKWMPTADEMQAVCKRFCEKGIYGLGTQIEAYNIWNNIFNFYTYGRTAYDTGLSMEDNLKLFGQIFGKGSGPVKEIIRLAEETVDGQVVISRAGTYLINNIDKNKVYGLFEKAFELADDKKSRNNIRMMRMVFRYSELQVKCIKSEDGSMPISQEERGEIWHIRDNFNSFESGCEGFAIAIDLKEENVPRSKSVYMPDKWYLFE